MKIVIATVVVIVAAGYWAYCLYDQNDRLEKAEGIASSVSQQINSGRLNNANASLKALEPAVATLKQEWAALPYIRKHELSLSGSIPVLRAAYDAKLKLTATVARKVINLAGQGKMDEAQAIIQKAAKTSAQNDENIEALVNYIDRLKVQDFSGAERASVQMSSLLAGNLPEDQLDTNTLAYITKVVADEKAKNFAAQQQIAAEVKSIMGSPYSAISSDDFKPVLKGKAMIWDATKSDIEMAYQLLPDNLRASSRDGLVTIFTILQREQILMGYYSVSHEPGYKEKMTIGVVYWPEKVNAGTAVVWGSDPAHQRIVTYSPGYGSSVNIKDWISSLPTYFQSPQSR
jgi:tetratricopeptide (TPR) repeat protein